MANVLDYLGGSLPNSIKVSDTQAIGIAGFDLDVRIKNSTKNESSAPVTVLEDGSFASDHIILTPTTLQIEGEVSDIKVGASPILDSFKRAIVGAGLISKYAPARTRSQINAVETLINDGIDATRKIDDVLNDGRQIYEMFGNKSQSVSPQQKFFDTMEKLRLSKQLIRIEMPFKIYEDMVITSITINTDNVTAPLSYSINAQEIRSARVELVGVERFKKNPSSGLNGQTDSAKNKGTNEGEEVEESLATQIKGLFSSDEKTPQ